MSEPRFEVVCCGATVAYGVDRDEARLVVGARRAAPGGHDPRMVELATAREGQ